MQLEQLRAAGWRPLEAGRANFLALCLAGQLREIRYLQRPGESEPERWARDEDIAEIEALPVALGFALPTDVQAALSREYKSILVAQAAPPPQFGDFALVLDGGNDTGEMRFWSYSVGKLDERVRTLRDSLEWEIRRFVKTGNQWPIATETFLSCAQGRYAELKKQLGAELQALPPGNEREQKMRDIDRLKIANEQAKALRLLYNLRRNNPQSWSAGFARIQEIARQLAGLYWQAHQATLKGTGDGAAMVATAVTLPSPADEAVERERMNQRALLQDAPEVYSEQSLTIFNHEPDHAIRKALLVDKKKWSDGEGLPRYMASKNLAVYFDDPKHPLDITEAQVLLSKRQPSAVLTARIATGLWNLAQREGRLSVNGDVAIPVSQILQLRGVEKLSRAAYPGSSKHYTEGYRNRDKEQVSKDMHMLEHVYLRGTCTIKLNNRPKDYQVTGPYLRVSRITEKTLWSDEDLIGFFISPGPWIETYRENDNYFLAEIDRRIFEFHPQNQQHEFKLALYLAERWRQQAKERRYDDPITMAKLLEESVIEVDRDNLTNRFIPRIEHALENLQESGIIRSFECRTRIDRRKSRWAKEWLASQWSILPPLDLVESYARIMGNAGRLSGKRGLPRLPAKTPVS